MGNATTEQARLMLELYDLRREARLRQAREWFVPFCHAETFDEVVQKFPPGSVESTNLRMVTSYWEMAASIVNRGLIDDELFFENNGEAWIVWDRIKPWIPGIRASFKNPHAHEHLEKFAARFEAWQEKRAPGAIETLRQRLASFGPPRAKAAKE